MADQDMTELRVQLAKLQIEHSDMDLAIDALITTGANAIAIQRFKKKKLALKDQITKLHSIVMPNIIA
jgi:hypothetical protein